MCTLCLDICTNDHANANAVAVAIVIAFQLLDAHGNSIQAIRSTFDAVLMDVKCRVDAFQTPSSAVGKKYAFIS